MVDYEASGTVEVKSISGTVGSYLILLSVALTLTVIFLLVGWTILGVLAVLAIIVSLVLIVICGHQLTLRAARKRLPSGRWSFRVRADAIEVTRAGATIRLSRGDIESVEFRSIRGSSSHKAIYARLRPGAAGRLHVMDGWYPLYWTSDFSSDRSAWATRSARCIRLRAIGRLAQAKVGACSCASPGLPWLVADCQVRALGRVGCSPSLRSSAPVGITSLAPLDTGRALMGGTGVACPAGWPRLRPARRLRRASFSSPSAGRIHRQGSAGWRPILGVNDRAQDPSCCW